MRSILLAGCGLAALIVPTSAQTTQTGGQFCFGTSQPAPFGSMSNNGTWVMNGACASVSPPPPPPVSPPPPPPIAVSATIAQPSPLVVGTYTLNGTLAPATPTAKVAVNWYTASGTVAPLPVSSWLQCTTSPDGASFACPGVGIDHAGVQSYLWADIIGSAPYVAWSGTPTAAVSPPPPPPPVSPPPPPPVSPPPPPPPVSPPPPPVSPPPPPPLGSLFFIAPGGSNSNPGTQAQPWADLANVQTAPAGSTILVNGQITSTCIEIANPNITIGTWGSGPISIKPNNSPVCSTYAPPTWAALIRVTAPNFTYNGGLMQLIGNGGLTSSGIFLDTTSGGSGDFATINNPDISGFYSRANTNNPIGEIVMHGVQGLVITGQGNDGLAGRASGHPVCYLHGETDSATSNDGNGVIGWAKPPYTITHCEVAFIGGTFPGAGYAGGKGNGILISLGAHTTGCTLTWNGLTGLCMIDQFVSTHDIGGSVAQCGGPAGNWSYGLDSGVFTDDESYRIHFGSSGCDGDGFDLDGGTSNTHVAWDYSHDNDQQGVNLFGSSNVGGNGQWGPNYVYGNISINDGSRRGASIGIGPAASGAPVYIFNNTLVSSTPNPTAASMFGIGGGNGPVGVGSIFKNNGLISYNAARFVDQENTPTNGPAYSNNGYALPASNMGGWRFGGTWTGSFSAWQALVMGGDIGSTTATPLMHSPLPSRAPAAPICNNTTTGPKACTALQAYMLVAGSAWRGAGTNPSVGAVNYNRDFFGTPTSGVWSIGAAQ